MRACFTVGVALEGVLGLVEVVLVGEEHADASLALCPLLVLVQTLPLLHSLPRLLQVPFTNIVIFADYRGKMVKYRTIIN